jgi:iron complex transport system permease protein
LNLRLTIFQRTGTLVILLLTLIIVSVAAAGIGAYYIAPWKIPSILANKADGHAVLTQIRFPRVLLGLIVGASLGIAGAALQGLFRNPLADPGLIGVSAGAGLGAALWVVLGASALPMLGPWGMTLAAFAGGALVTWLAWKMANVQHLVSTVHLLLAGVAFNSLAGSGIGALIFLSDDEQLRTITFWMLGGLGGATWPAVTASGVIALIGMIILLPLGRALNLLALGEVDAYHLGLNTKAINHRVILGGTLAVGAAVSAAGGIGFIGLVIPHLLRLFIGPDHRFLLPGSAILGATLLVASDLVARTAAAPLEVPVGVITAFFGAPFFLWLVWKQRRMLSYA